MVERFTGLHRDAVLRMLVEAGERCEALMDRFVNVECTDVQADEVLGICGQEGKEQRARSSRTIIQ
jgi:hypothetical protein